MQPVEKQEAIPEEERFSRSGERLIFDNVPWKDWEVAGVEAVRAALDKEEQPLSRSKSDLLRFLHLAISYRSSGNTGTCFTEEDVDLTVQLLLKSQTWKEENQPTWTPQLRDAFKNIVFMMEGRDLRRRPVGIIRPLKAERETWTKCGDLNKAILALTDEEMSRAYIPGVAEQAVFIVDLHAVGLRDVPSLVPSLGELVGQLTDNYTGRGGTFFILNAGWTLSTAVNAVLMFAQEETRSKVQVFRGGLPEKHAKLCFGVATLPREFGGEAALGC